MVQWVGLYTLTLILMYLTIYNGLYVPIFRGCVQTYFLQTYETKACKSFSIMFLHRFLRGLPQKIRSPSAVKACPCMQIIIEKY